jgi:hypothetical protein
MGFTDETFPAGTHMCLIYGDQAECDDLIQKFLSAGLIAGEKVGYFTDRMETEQFAERFFNHADKKSAPSLRKNQFEVRNAVDTYCPTGRFTPDGMFDTLRTYHRQSRDDGFPNIRASGEMTWALKGIPGSDRLMEYEALLNNLLVVCPITAICQYDATRFDGKTIFDVLRVHPMMIVHGQIVRNPYYLRPEDFLKTHG